MAFEACCAIRGLGIYDHLLSVLSQILGLWRMGRVEGVVSGRSRYLPPLQLSRRVRVSLREAVRLNDF